MFQEAKKHIGEHNAAARGTGGGPPPKPVPDIYLRIRDLIPGQFQRIANPTDDDAAPTPVTDPDGSFELAVEPASPDGQPLRQERAMLTVPPKAPTPARSIRSAPDRRRPQSATGTPVTSSGQPLSAFDAARMEFVQLQIDYLREEHAAKMKVYDQQYRAAVAQEQHFASMNRPASTFPQPPPPIHRQYHPPPVFPHQPGPSSAPQQQGFAFYADADVNFTDLSNMGQ